MTDFFTNMNLGTQYNYEIILLIMTTSVNIPAQMLHFRAL